MDFWLSGLRQKLPDKSPSGYSNAVRCVNCHATHSLPVLENVWKPLYEVPSPSRTSTAGSKLPFFFACFSSSSFTSGVSSNPTPASLFGGFNLCSSDCKASASVLNASAVFSTSCKISVNEFCCCSVVACCTDAATTLASGSADSSTEPPPSGSHSSDWPPPT